MATTAPATTDTEAIVLGEAVLNAGAKLGLNPQQVGSIIGRNRTTIVRNGVDPGSPNGQLAMLLVRLYRSLYVLVGGHEDDMHHWMQTRVGSLQGIPMVMIQDVSGLVRVTQYLDAMRGKA